MKQMLILLSTLVVFSSNLMSDEDDCFDYINDEVSFKLAKYTKTIDETLSTEATRKKFSQLIEDEDYYYRNNKTYLKISVGSEYTESYSTELIQKIKLKLDLPLAKRSLKLFVDGDYEQNNVDAKNYKENTSLGLETSLSKKIDSKVRVGISSFDNPYIKYRLGISKEYGDIVIEPYQYVKYSRKDEFYESTNLIIDKIFDKTSLSRLFLYRSSQTDSHGMNFGASLSWFKSLTDHKSLAFRVGMSGETKPINTDKNIVSYSISSDWKQNIFKEYMFLYVTPFMRFSRDRDYKSNAGVRVLFEWKFTNAKI